MVANSTDDAVGQTSECRSSFFAALSATSEAILRTATAEELFQKVCDALISTGDVLGAAILCPVDASGRLEVVAGAGRGIDALRSAEVSASEHSPYGNGLMGSA